MPNNLPIDNICNIKELFKKIKNAIAQKQIEQIIDFREYLKTILKTIIKQENAAILVEIIKEASAIFLDQSVSIEQLAILFEIDHKDIFKVY